MDHKIMSERSSNSREIPSEHSVVETQWKPADMSASLVAPPFYGSQTLHALTSQGMPQLAEGLICLQTTLQVTLSI